jgi:hypothetical protein
VSLFIARARSSFRLSARRLARSLLAGGGGIVLIPVLVEIFEFVDVADATILLVIGMFAPAKALTTENL